MRIVLKHIDFSFVKVLLLNEPNFCLSVNPQHPFCKLRVVRLLA
jgi:hypothetical protein